MPIFDQNDQTTYRSGENQNLDIKSQSSPNQNMQYTRMSRFNLNVSKDMSSARDLTENLIDKYNNRGFLDDIMDEDENRNNSTA